MLAGQGLERLRRAAWVACLTLGGGAPAGADCVFAAEQAYGLPHGILSAIAVVEGAGAGFARRNVNGSADLGLMQINTAHWPEVQALLGPAASPWRAIYSRCYSAALGGWVVARELRSASNMVDEADFWAAIGGYHSSDPDRRAAYGERVRAVWERMVSE